MALLDAVALTGDASPFKRGANVVGVRMVRAAKKLGCAGGVALTTLCCAMAARAEESANPLALPMTGLAFDAGGAVRLRPTHLGADVYTADFVPFLDGQWGKDLHFSIDDGVQWTVLRAGQVTFGPDAEYRQPYTDKLAPRVRRTANALEAGVFTKVNLTYAELDMRVRKALNGYQGYSGDISLDTAVPLRPKWTLGLEARFGWADRRFASRQFGKSVTVVGDYYNFGGQAALVYQWRPRTRVALGVSEDQVLRPSRPISGATTRNAATLFLAVTHRFSWR